MFTNVIGSLTGLLPRNFIFAVYIPVLIYTSLNGVLLYITVAWVRGAVQVALHDQLALFSASCFIGTIVLAYILSSLTDAGREVLEGKHLRVLGRLVDEMRRDQERKYGDIATDYNQSRVLGYQLSAAVPVWQEALRVAGNAGAAEQLVGFGQADPAMESLENLRSKSRKATVSREEIQAAVDAMGVALTKFNVMNDVTLQSARRDLLVVIGRIASRAHEREYALATRLQLFPLAGELMPTALGNIAASLQSYGVDRYGMDTAVFLNRLQAVLTKRADDKGYSLVIDAKTQLDFLVAACFLSGFTGVTWAVLLAILGSSIAMFVFAAVSGFLLPMMFYTLCVQSYATYAQTLRACIDLNRFTLLKALDVPLPLTLREERQLWAALSHAALMGSEGLEISYDHAQ
jgi:hypothetical protein